MFILRLRSCGLLLSSEQNFILHWRTARSRDERILELAAKWMKPWKWSQNEQREIRNEKINLTNKNTLLKKNPALKSLRQRKSNQETPGHFNSIILDNGGDLTSFHFETLSLVAGKMWQTKEREYKNGGSEGMKKEQELKRRQHVYCSINSFSHIFLYTSVTCLYSLSLCTVTKRCPATAMLPTMGRGDSSY